ncbi:cAMP-dependent protein kinase subunit [Coelomomyces lativittatus]|nr:cAMP-dependent protein kinase subunit [Coelomomyces lativittatus]
MANLNTLYSCLESPRQVFIVDQLNSVTLLGPGLHRIHCTFPLETLHCGLIPLEGEVKVKTSGLKWNLDNDILKFGHFISTSNQRLLEHTATDIPECFLPIHLSPVDDPMYTSPTKSVTPLHMNEGHQCSTVFIQCNGPLFWIQTLDLSQLETR